MVVQQAVGKENRPAILYLRRKGHGRHIFCLADKESFKIPSPAERTILHDAGLGAKKVQFFSDDNEHSGIEGQTD